jgi:hypothetical protein
MGLRFVVMSGCLAIMLALGTVAIASAKDTSTCETLSGSLSGPEKDSFLKKCEETFRTGHVCVALNHCCKEGTQNCCDTARIEHCNP